MPRELTCEERVLERCTDRLSDLRTMLHGVSASNVSLVDDGTLDTVLVVVDEEHRFPDTSAHRNCDTGELDLDSLLNECGNDINDQLIERFWEYGLSFDYVEPGTFAYLEKGYFRYQIAYGGPTEEFRFYINPDKTCHTIEFWLLDWFDGASLIMCDDDKDLMTDVYEQLNGHS